MNGVSEDATVMAVKDSEQVDTNGSCCYCGGACKKDRKLSPPPHKTTLKQRQRISRKN